ncbi:CHAT domain-containing protein [Nonomuraea sp. 3N208]
MSSSGKRDRPRIGCSFNILWTPILAAAVTAFLGGPWWVPLSCLAILVLGGLWSLPVTGVLGYLTWGTWWMAAPMAALATDTAIRIWMQPWRLLQRGERSFALYHRTGRRRQLLRAVERFRRALAVARPYDPNRALYASDYVGALVALHAREDRPDVLEYAERLGRETLESLPSGHPHRVPCLSSLGSVLLARYEREDDRALLEEHVRLCRQAVTAPDRAGQDAALLANLGAALILLYQRTENAETLREGLRACRDAVAAAEPGPMYAHLLTNLQSALSASYAINGELAMLEEAVAVGREQIAAFQAHRLMADTILANLAGTLLLLFERTRRPALLDEAVGMARRALAACPPDHAERDKFLAGLGRVLLLATEIGDRRDLADEAVRTLSEALAVLPAGDARRADRLGDLCAALVKAFAVHGRPQDLLEAVKAGHEALALTPDNDPDRVLTLVYLGGALRARYEHNGDAADLAESCRAHAEAAGSASGPVSVRVKAAWRAAELYIRARDHRAALAMAELAVGRIPLIAPRRLGLYDRVHRAVDLAGLAATAAEAAIGAGEPGRAVELLEQARGVVLGGVFDTRGGFTELRSRAPGLARELDDLIRAIERADQDPDAVPLPAARNPQPPPAARGHDALSELRTRLDRQWDELLARIRRQPGLRDFLLPPPIGRLRRQAAEGPIVYVMAHRDHGSALIVTGDQSSPVIAVDLPLLTQQAVGERVEALRATQLAATAPGAVSRRRQAQQDTFGILAWLWDAVAAPVLDAVGLTGPPVDGGRWPRIWWCPVGSCAFLPLHAAGRHADGGHDNVLDRAMSSYTTTIRALDHSRRFRLDARAAPSALVVSVPDAPGTAPLPGAAAEADLLERLLHAATVLHAPDRAAVVSALPDHEIAHFACHGVADLHAPADSRLLLHDHLERALTVSTISRLRLSRGELAYLSACSTTDTTARHADEAVHVTAAFQLAGYRGVVGTLWPVNDRAAVAIAESFYTHLARPGTNIPDPTAAATALHRSIHKHRALYPALPTQWASHIHHGP